MILEIDTNLNSISYTNPVYLHFSLVADPLCVTLKVQVDQYRIIPNRSTGCLDNSPGGGYIRFGEPGATITNMIYKRNQSSKLGGAFIRRGAFIGDNTVCKSGTLSL